MTFLLKTNSVPSARFWRWIFTLAALEALAACIWLASLPSDAGAGPLGFSAERLLLMGLLVAAGFISACLAWAVCRPTVRAWLKPPLRRVLRNALFLLLPALAFFSGAVLIALLNLYHTSGAFHYLAYYQRLLPPLVWLILTSLELFAVLAWTGGFHWRALAEQRSVFRAWLGVWAAFGLAALFVALTGIGRQPDVVGWGRPTVALLEWQIGLAWAAGTIFLLALARRGSPASPRWNARLDWLLAAAIWLLAVSLWLGQPVRPAFFATQGRAPNYEIYPFSDGAYYGTFAQSLLIGNGFKVEEIPPRPFYISLLAVFHAIGGQAYEHVIILQTLFLAFFPVVLYLLGGELHSRPAGLAAALLVILRELTAVIAVPFTDNASNSKLFFADLPSALALSLWVYVVVRWMRDPLRRWLAPLVVGGGMGLVMLFRTQGIFLLPAVLLAALLLLRRRRGAWLRSVLLLVIGLGLAVAPWLWRNWETKGELAFDDPKSQTGAMAARYSLDGHDPRYTYQPGEDVQAYADRVTHGIFEFIFTHPNVVARFVTAHFLNAETANVLVLPVRAGLNSPAELWMPTEAFWEFWQGDFTAGQAALFFLNLGLIALGVGACWARLGWAGLVPLLANLSYNFSMALARNSGGRYLLAVDWVAVLYAAVGLLEISLAVCAALGLSPRRLALLLAGARSSAAWAEQTRPRIWMRRHPWMFGLSTGLAFLLMGAFPLAVERLAPVRYPQASQDQLLEEALRAAPSLDRSAAERFLAQPGAGIVKGRALYPRYYAAGEGEPYTAKAGYQPLDYPRTVFQVVSAQFNGLAILKDEQPPAVFPNASDVLLLGCVQAAYLEPAALIVLVDPPVVYTAAAGLFLDCASITPDSK